MWLFFVSERVYKERHVWSIVEYSHSAAVWEDH